MPSHGIKITNSTQIVLATPPMSLLRKMSPKIQKRHMIQAKNRKNSSSASRNDPLSLNINEPFGEARTVPDPGPRPVSCLRRAMASTDQGETAGCKPINAANPSTLKTHQRCRPINAANPSTLQTHQRCKPINAANPSTLKTHLHGA